MRKLWGLCVGETSLGHDQGHHWFWLPPAKIFLWTFLSASLCWLACVTISSGQLVRSANHSGPLHHSCRSVTLAPRLPRSAGFSVEGTWRHWVFGWLWIFRTRFVTNWRYSPWSRNQSNATVLSNQQIVPFRGKWEPVDCFSHLEIHKFFEIRKLHYRDQFCQKPQWIGPIPVEVCSMGSLAALLVPCVCLASWILVRMESCLSFSSSSLWYLNFLSISSFSNSSCSRLAQNGVVNEHVGCDFFLWTWHTGSFFARF